MGKYVSGKLTVGERPVHNDSTVLEIDCHSYLKCPYGKTGGIDNCHHLGRVPQSFDDANELPGCAGTGGKPWTRSERGDFTTYSARVVERSI